MKYMGSKRGMLENGLGKLIKEQSHATERIVDSFCGSGAIAWYAAENTRKIVVAADLQEYAVALARAVITRTSPLDPHAFEREWLAKAIEVRSCSVLLNAVSEHNARNWLKEPLSSVEAARQLCSEPLAMGPIWNAYGGYYFSPLQALTLDALWATLPTDETLRSVALAALISAASGCAAAPGHTAQPFQPTRQAGPHLVEAWRRDPIEQCRKALVDICPRHASKRGNAYTKDALDLSTCLQPRDLVIVDPPYSAVHYSRFYHVLETVAKGVCGPTSGVGRYPPISERPRSRFSIKSQSQLVMSEFLQRLREREVRVIMTFPADEASNGLSGTTLVALAQQHFRVETKVITGNFSTLGGNKNHRPARQLSRELILLLSPN